jgi:hypothetical protein
LLRIASGEGWAKHPNPLVRTACALDARQLPRHAFSRTMTQLYLTLRNHAVAQHLLLD